MPYKVKIPELTVLEKIGEIIRPDGSVLSHEHRSVTYFEDDEIADNKVSPVIVAAYDDGDEHTLKVLERIPEEKPAVRRGRKPAASDESEE